MNPAEFQRNLSKKQAELKQYFNNVFPVRAGNMALRFIEGNFSAQGWQGSGFQPWKPLKKMRLSKAGFTRAGSATFEWGGSILIKTGRLRRGTTFSVTPGIAHVVNNVPYAAVHNQGFNGTVNVASHTRKKLQAGQVTTGRMNKSGNAKMKTIHTVASVSQVKAHTRKLNIPKRQFMPNNMQDSPVFEQAVSREIQRSLKQIF